MPDTFADLPALATPMLRPVMQALRDVILSRDPSATEVIRLGHRAASHGPGPEKMSQAYAYIMPQPCWINLGFYRGGPVLPDPTGLLDGAGTRLRHVKIDAVNDAATPALLTLLDAARRERLAALGILSPAPQK